MRLAVVPCSAAKLDRDAAAGDLYRGSLTRSALLAAEQLQLAGVVDQVVILSALHGLLPPSWVIAPYDVTWGDPRAVDVGELAAQLPGGAVVLPLLPTAYSDRLAAAVAVAQLKGVRLAVNPLAGSRGLLEQRRRLRVLREQAAAVASLDLSPRVLREQDAMAATLDLTG